MKLESPRAKCYLLAIAYISYLILVQPSSAQTPQHLDNRVQLVVKTGFPNFSSGYTGEVLFSPGERFAAIHGPGIVIVFDLRLRYEVRRISISSRSGSEAFVTPLNQQLAFSNRADSLYVGEGGRIVKCKLLDDDPCSPIIDDAASGMAISADDKLAYINCDGAPVVLNLKDLAQRVVLPQTVPSADQENFSWRILRFDERSGHAEQLALVGEINRESTEEDVHHRKKEEPREDWRMSSFAIATGQVMNEYGSVPLSVTSAAYGSNGRLLLCGSKLSDAGNADAPDRVFDTATHVFAEKRPAPFEDGCLKGLGVMPMNKSWPTPPLPPGEQLQGVWGSPQGDLVIYSTKTLDGRNGLYLMPVKNPADAQLLTGRVAPMESIEFLPKHPMLVSRFVNSYVWNFAGGTMLTWAWYTRFSADGKIAAAFVPNANQTWDLTYWSLPGFQVTLPGVQLKKAPQWLGLSADGGTVAILEKGRVSFFTKGTETDFSCTSNDFGVVSSTQKPVVNAAGTKMVALCRRDENNPAENGLSAYLIVWDLETLTETRIPADENDRYFAIAWDDSAFLLGGGKRLRLIDAKTLRATKFRSKSVDDFIEAVAFRPDNSSAVLTVRNLQSLGGKLLFIDLKTGKMLDSLVEPAEIKSIAFSADGYLAVLSANDAISLYSPKNTRLVRMITAGPYDWVVLSDSGFFDGTADALRWVGYRLKGGDAPVTTIETLFNELYRPGLLLEAAQGRIPELPTGIDISTYLEVPGLRLLLQQGDLRPVIGKDGKTVLCMDRESLYEALQSRGSMVSPGDDPQCRFEAIPSDQENPTLLLKALNGLALPQSTRWDTGQISANANTVHVLTVATGKYADSKGFPEIPTVVPSVRKLQDALLQHSTGDNVHVWNKEGCGAALEDQDATKANILHCIDLVVQAAKPDDMVVLAFAGHGGPNGTDNELFYFYPYDARAGEQDPVAISSAELADRLRFLRAKRLVLIVDACESGAAMQPLGSVLEAKMRIADLVPSEQSAGAASSNSNMQGALLIAASSGIEAATSTEEQNPFFNKLLASLSDYQPSDARTWAHAIAAKMKEASSLTSAGPGGRYPIKPYVLAIGADFAITRSKP